MATKIKLNKGDSVWFAACSKPFKVRAANDRFAICTQPYNFKPKSVIYTIIDFERNVRGLDNMVLGIYSYYTDEECVAALQDLINGTMEVSYRASKNVELDIIKVKSYGNNIIEVEEGRTMCHKCPFQATDCTEEIYNVLDCGNYNLATMKIKSMEEEQCLET